MRVAFFGAFDPAYPRNIVLREALESSGVEPVSISVPPGTRPVAREGSLVLQWLRASGGIDAVIVPAFGHRDVPLARLLGRTAGAPVLFDPLVSRWDTQVTDLGRCRPGSAAAGRLRASDRLAFSLADLVLCDTWEHGDFYSESYDLPRRKLCRVPVGAPWSAFRRGEGRAPRGGSDSVEVVYVGGFIPLHGVPTIVEAATILEERHGPRFARFVLIGDGMTAPRAERDLAARGLRSVWRVPRVSQEEALERLARADIALGIFGTTPKAGRVVPHKVYQALALGTLTITRRSAAISEFFRDGQHLVLVPPGDAPALAAAIEALAKDPERRARIGEAGRAAALEQVSPERIGACLVDAIQRARASTEPRLKR